MLTHLRRNAVGYLALVVALATGSAYAATELPKKLPKHSVGAKQLKKNAVTGNAVKDGSLGAAELAAGVLPPGTTIFHTGKGGDPVEHPDEMISSEQPFTATVASTVRIEAVWNQLGLSCSGGGTASAGLYVDGVAVPESNGFAPSVGSSRPFVLSGVTRVGPGPHTATIGYDCFGVAIVNSGNGVSPSLDVLVVPGG
jgi:hypothetical protein